MVDYETYGWVDLHAREVRGDISGYLQRRYPEDTKKIDLGSLKLEYLPSLKRFSKLKLLDISNNQLHHLPELPEGLDVLYCHRNQLTSLRNVPSTVTILMADCNKLKRISSEEIPSVKYLCVAQNQIERIVGFPQRLEYFYACANEFNSLPPFPDTLTTINVSDNDLVELPTLPPFLWKLYCDRNARLSRLPNIPSTLRFLQCFRCRLSRIPRLPDGVVNLDMADNPIRIMENIPTGLLHRISGNIPLFDVIAPRNLENAFLTWMEIMDICRSNLQTLNRFRELYYAIKFKAQFRRWMWNKHRIARIERDNHPDRLREALDAAEEEDGEDVDMEVVLQRLGKH